LLVEDGTYAFLKFCPNHIRFIIRIEPPKQSGFSPTG
jgi:hypothetical protein